MCVCGGGFHQVIRLSGSHEIDMAQRVDVLMANVLGMGARGTAEPLSFSLLLSLPLSLSLDSSLDSTAVKVVSVTSST